MKMTGDRDLMKMKKVALESSSRAWCPYSNFPVGAALLLSDGTIIPGCNVENVSYGISSCAERTAIFSAVAQGYARGDFVALLIYMPGDRIYTPCGACRQVIAEFFAPNGVIYATCDTGERKEWTVEELLPNGFNF